MNNMIDKCEPCVVYSLHEEAMIARVVLSNKAHLNALNLSMWTQLASVFQQLSLNASLRCIVLEGEGDKAFAAGGDIEEFSRIRMNLEGALAYHEDGVVPALKAILACPVPTVAAIRGACVGGGLEIACCCDLRLACESAFFGIPIMKLGFSMYPGEMALLFPQLGRALLLELLLEGRLLKAEEALSKGLVTRIFPKASFAAQIDATALRIASGAPLVARAHKQWIRRMHDPAPLQRDEKQDALRFLQTQDYREGVHAFLEKRSPCFTGC